MQSADEQIEHANNAQRSAAAQAAAQASATAASEMLSAASWLVEGKRGGPLRAAADSQPRGS